MLPCLNGHAGEGAFPHAVVEEAAPALLAGFAKGVWISVSLLDEDRMEAQCEALGLLPRSAARMVVISSHSATTSGLLTSPPAWIRARISMASSTRPTFASQRGDRGRNGRPARRNTQGMNWIAQAVLNEFVPAMNEQPNERVQISLY